MLLPRFVTSNCCRTLSTKTPNVLPFQVSGLTGRYVQAIYSAAVTKNECEMVCADSFRFMYLLDNKSKLKGVLMSPMVERKDKIDLVDRLSKELKLSQICTESVKLILSNKREKILYRIFSHLNTIGNVLKGEVKCNITLANPINGMQKTELLNTVKGFLKTGQYLKVEFKIVPEIVGGCQIEIGDRYIDLSFAAQLEEYTKAMQE